MHPFKTVPRCDGLVTRTFNPAGSSFRSFGWGPFHVKIFQPLSKTSDAAGKLSAQGVVLVSCPPPGVITPLLPRSRVHRGLGLLFLMNFKGPLTRGITFLLVYLFIDRSLPK